MGFGIWVGEGPWLQGGVIPPPVPDVGLVSGNAISGAVVNMAVDKISAGVIRDNTFYGAQGNRGMLGCVWPAELTVGNIGSASVQPGSIFRTWQGVCTPYVNAAPAARLTGPNDGQGYLTSHTVVMTADARDPDTSVTRVDFFGNGTFLGSDNLAPYSYSVPGPLPVGTFDLTAVAYEGSTRGPTSNIRRITVTQAPSVTISSPANTAVIPVGSMVTISAATTGAISNVDFYAFIGGGWMYLGSDASAPFSIGVGPVAYGDYPIGAIGNGSVISPIITVYVR